MEGGFCSKRMREAEKEAQRVSRSRRYPEIE
jgi:hypothetical protein